jgi:hypothetical protein
VAKRCAGAGHCMVGKSACFVSRVVSIGRTAFFAVDTCKVFNCLDVLINAISARIVYRHPNRKGVQELVPRFIGKHRAAVADGREACCHEAGFRSKTKAGDARNQSLHHLTVFVLLAFAGMRTWSNVTDGLGSIVSPCYEMMSTSRSTMEERACGYHLACCFKLEPAVDHGHDHTVMIAQISFGRPTGICAPGPRGQAPGPGSQLRRCGSTKAASEKQAQSPLEVNGSGFGSLQSLNSKQNITKRPPGTRLSLVSTGRLAR